MKKEEKQVLVDVLHRRLEQAKASFLVDYQGLNVEAMSRLRGDLRQAGAEFQVVKNRLLKLASQQTDTASIVDSMRGPSAIALTDEDVAGCAKTLVAFAKSFERLKIKRGQISGKVLEAEGIKKLAELPGRDVLLAQALSAMQAVPTSLVRVLNGIIAKLLYALKAIEQQKAQPADAE